jgi:lysine-specific demethylase 8
MAVQGPCHKKRKIQSLTQREAAPSRENILQDKVAAIAETLSSQIDVENDETLAACGPAPLSIVRTRPQAVLDLAHEKMHTFPYHSVPVHWRRLYEDASCHLAVSILRAKPFSA